MAEKRKKAAKPKPPTVSDLQKRIATLESRVSMLEALRHTPIPPWTPNQIPWQFRGAQCMGVVP